MSNFVNLFDQSPAAIAIDQTQNSAVLRASEASSSRRCRPRRRSEPTEIANIQLALPLLAISELAESAGPILPAWADEHPPKPDDVCSSISLETPLNIDAVSPSQLDLARPPARPITNLNAQSIRAAIDTWADLRASRRAALITAVKHTERIFGSSGSLPQGVEQWSCAGLNRVLWCKPHAVHGLSKDVFRNMLTNLRFVLVRLRVHANSGHGRNVLSPEWQTLFNALPSDEYRKGLVRFFRFLTLSGVTPDTITPDSMDEFAAWCRNEILLDDAAGVTRRAAGNWAFARNNVPGWPQVELHRTGMRDHYALPWDTFPSSFKADADRFLVNLAAGPGSPFKATNPYAALGQSAQRSGNTKSESPRSSRRALRARTIETRRWQIRVSASALVLSGVPTEQITSLRSLVQPVDRVIKILEYHRNRMSRRKAEQGEAVADDDLRSSNLIGIGEVLRQISKFEARVSDDDMDQLNGIIGFVRPEAQQQMSDKNMSRLKQMFRSPVYEKLLNLPEYWITREATKPSVKQKEAALLVMYAVALEILLFLPLRRGNLLELRLDKHLGRPGAGGPIDEIRIAANEVKNRNAINWPVPAHSARLLEIYLKKHRPLLAKLGNAFLFPGIGDGHRDDCEFGAELSKRVTSAIGAAFNCHLVRHFAVVRYLRQNPGAYEIAANILGHKNPETTRRFYCGLELDAAARHANDVLINERRTTKTLALGAFHKPNRKPRGNTTLAADRPPRIATSGATSRIA